MVAATRRLPEADAFRDRLRARTPYLVITPAFVAINVAVAACMLSAVTPFNDPATLLGMGRQRRTAHDKRTVVAPGDVDVRAYRNAASARQRRHSQSAGRGARASRRAAGVRRRVCFGRRVCRPDQPLVASSLGERGCIRGGLRPLRSPDRLVDVAAVCGSAAAIRIRARLGIRRRNKSKSRGRMRNRSRCHASRCRSW